MKYYELTVEGDEKFAQKIAAGINKDFPGVAKVEGGQCLITNKYYARCKKHVKENCNLVY